MADLTDPAWIAWLSAPARLGWPRVKDERAAALSPGGRCRLTLFEQVDGGRPHPRLRVSLPPVADPSPPGPLFRPLPPPADASGFAAALDAALAEHADLLDGRDLDDREGPVGSERFWRASIVGQRKERLFDEARSFLRAHGATWTAAGRDAASLALATAEALAFAGSHHFDDADTGTYHSYGKDAPFVHVLERVLATVPAPGSAAFDLLPPEQQEAVRAQRRQCQAHLDFLMRRKYAHEGVDERDIERSIGGRLIDTVRRQVLSPVMEPGDVSPRLELLRIAPGAAHPHAGAWVHRRSGSLALRDGTLIQVDEADLRVIPVEPGQVSFERAPGDPLLRPAIPFDWDGDGLVADEPIAWVAWAGHCDLKAIQEALGLTLTGQPPPRVREHRSDTGETHDLDRDLLLEALTALLEFGSSYRTFDGSEDVVRGITRFGGARNDSLPDRLQLQGPGPGKSFRWPLSRRREAFRVERLVEREGVVDLETAFLRHLPDRATLGLVDNPRYLKTVEGDYNLIDVSGLRLGAEVEEHTFDPVTGAYHRSRGRIELDLGRTEGRSPLGSHLQDPGAREIYRVWLDHARPAVIAELERWERGDDGRFAPRPVPERNVVLPMVAPLRATLSRELERDDPSGFQALLEAALRRGEGIVADTDEEAPVWNGVVTRLAVERVAASEASRVEHWRVDVQARFGEATLEYLVRRSADGEPEAWAALAPEPSWTRSPDFLWQDFPDVGSKGRERGTWIVNRAMVDRGVVELVRDETVAGGVYVHDEHVKNLAEVLWCALAGRPWTLVHGNKRYAFDDEQAWRDAIDEITALRQALLGGAGAPTA